MIPGLELYAKDQIGRAHVLGGEQHDYIAAVRHQVVGTYVREAENITQHFSLFFVDNALLGTLMQNHFQFFLCHLPFFPVFHADKLVCQKGFRAI